MAQELRAALTLADSGDVRRVRPMTRLIVLPFRVLRADPDVDFSFSLADAITTRSGPNRSSSARVTRPPGLRQDRPI